MRIAAVECEGITWWVDAVDHRVRCLDRVHIRLASGNGVAGQVTVTPEQWVQPPVETGGVIVAVFPKEVSVREMDLPGADLPPLGTLATVDGVTGIVTAIDPLQGTVTVEGESGLPAPRAPDPAP